MIKKLNALKNQKGMTLVELLAVMVIIGIIAAISIPAIGGLIENTRKDAAVSTATSLVEAARIYVAAEGINEGTVTLTATGATGKDAKDLVTSGYLDTNPKDPKKSVYTTAQVVVTFDANNKATYTVTLSNDNTYNINDVDASTLERSSVSPS